MIPAIPTTCNRFALFCGTLLFGLFAYSARAVVTAGQITNSNFVLDYDARGISGLANPNDPFAAQMLAPGQHLALTVKYRTRESNEWENASANDVDVTAAPEQGRVEYASAN